MKSIYAKVAIESKAKPSQSTLANLRGYIESQGGIMIAAASLTGKSYSAKLMPPAEQLLELREKLGACLNKNLPSFATGCSTWTKRRGIGKLPAT